MCQNYHTQFEKPTHLVQVLLIKFLMLKQFSWTFCKFLLKIFQIFSSVPTLLVLVSRETIQALPYLAQLLLLTDFLYSWKTKIKMVLLNFSQIFIWNFAKIQYCANVIKPSFQRNYSRCTTCGTSIANDVSYALVKDKG